MFKESDIVLSAKHIVKQFPASGGRTLTACNDVNLNVYKGKTLGIVGETGAGKTTTAMSILRLLPERTGNIRKGSITYDGRNLLELPIEEMQRVRGEKISMIFQDPMSSLNPVITVGDQIAEVLQLHEAAGGKSGKRPGKRLGKPSPEIMKRVDEILEMVGIPTERKSEYPHQFSGGMKQRIVIAIALACEPDLLLADEPTTALDVTIQAQVLEMMGNLQKELGTAMILITHDLGVVAESCDSVAVMYAGQIIESGTIEDIFTGSNHHPYTTGLFGAIPDMESKKSRLDPIPGLMADPTKEYTGCRFAERCKHCTEACLAREPAEKIVGSHMIRCHLFQ